MERCGPGRERPPTSRSVCHAPGRAVRLGQEWLVPVVVRNVAMVHTGAAARVDAGILVDAVLNALLGWQPQVASLPLTLTNLPTPGYVTGQQWVPLIFSTEIVRHVM